MQQTDLFEPRETAQIFAFPARRLASRIRYTAQQVARRREPIASKFFRCECSRLFAAYQVSGLTWDQAQEQVRLFADAVQTEIEVQHHRQKGTPHEKNL